MKAVNLIPADERRGGASGTGRSGGAVYGLLAALGVLLLAFGAYAVLSRQVADREQELVHLRAEAERVSAQAAALKPYGEFARLSTERAGAVRTLARARVDWERVLRELSVALPADARLASLDAAAAAPASATGTAAPATGAAAPAGGTPAPGGPTLTLSGCLPTDRDVADMLVRLRQMSGVRAVELGQASEDDAEAVAGAPANCATAFDATVTFAALPGTDPSAAVPPAGAPAPAAGAQAAEVPEATPAADSEGGGEQ